MMGTLVVTESDVSRCSVKKVFLKILQNSQESTCVRPEACNFIKKEALAQIFSYEFPKFLKNLILQNEITGTALMSLPVNLSTSFVVVFLMLI